MRLEDINIKELLSDWSSRAREATEIRLLPLGGSRAREATEIRLLPLGGALIFYRYVDRLGTYPDGLIFLDDDGNKKWDMTFS